MTFPTATAIVRRLAFPCRSELGQENVCLVLLRPGTADEPGKLIGCPVGQHQGMIDDLVGCRHPHRMPLVHVPALLSELENKPH